VSDGSRQKMCGRPVTAGRVAAERSVQGLIAANNWQHVLFESMEHFAERKSCITLHAAIFRCRQS